MSKAVKILALGVGVVLVVIVGITLGWMGTGGNTPEISSTLRAPEPAVSTRTRFAKSPTAREGATEPTNSAAPPMEVSTNLITDWEGRLDHILSADTPETDKAHQMLELFPNLPESGQVEVAQHLSNLLGDSDYAPLGQLLTKASLSEAVLDVLMADVLNRPNSLKLPLLLQVAREPQHPKATEAKDLLELFLQDNFDQDWDRWQTKLDQWLKDNPD